MKTADFHDFMPEIYESCNHMIWHAIGRHQYTHDFPIAKASDEDPPIIEETNGIWDDLPLDFEMLLGVYLPDSRQVIKYTKGILWAADTYDWHPKRLERLVEIHEQAHFLHHLGYFEGQVPEYPRSDEFIDNKDDHYNSMPDETKEQIAQLMTVVTLKSKQKRAKYDKSREVFADMESILYELMRYQSRMYCLPESVRETDFDRLQEKAITLLRIVDKGANVDAEDVAGILV